MFQERDLPTLPAWTLYDNMKIDCSFSQLKVLRGNNSFGFEVSTTYMIRVYY